MPTASLPNTKRKHKDAVAEYNRLTSLTETVCGKPYKKYTNELCLAKAAFKHYMEPRTLENILYRH